ncbi:TRAP transporter substrate-binding protein DctP, partial [Chloroflexota bacterium]
PVPTITPAPVPTTTATTPKPATKPIELRWAMDIGVTRERFKQVYGPLFQKMEDASNGSVKVTVYPDQTLCAAVDTFDAVISGVADMAEANHGYVPGRFPLTEIIRLPGLGISSTKAGAYIMRDMYDKFPEVRAEYSDLKLIFNYRLPAQIITTVRTPIRKPEDMKGLKIRTQGAIAGDAIKAMGGVPVLMAMGDVYMALQRGLLDGLISAPDTLVTRKFYEIEKHLTTVDMGGSTDVCIMNQQSFDKLPANIQKVITDSIPWCIETMPGAWDGEVEAAVKAKPADFDWYTLTKEEAAVFNAATASVRENYSKQWASRGPAQAILDEVISLANKYSDVK